MRAAMVAVAGVCLLIVVAAGAWLAPKTADAPVEMPVAAVPVEEATVGQRAADESAMEPMVEIIGDRYVPAPEALLAEQNRDPDKVPVPSEAVVAALRDSMENGDSRTPPLARSDDLREMPSAAELADPALYQQYEQRQNQKVYASFAAAASDKINELERMIARAEAEGLPPEQIDEGRRKLEGLRNQRDEILLAHPEITEGSQSSAAGEDGQE